jgi:membrane associated rhomboid family serine protease
MSSSQAGGTGAGPGSAPVCPRHPDTVSYVRCQRCERPVCPECQRPAAVGVQCVDCVKAQAKTVRKARTVFGGNVVDSRPVVTSSIIAVCVAVFVAQMVGGDAVTQELNFYPVAAFSQPYRFITSAFLHSTNFVPHIVMNLYALWLLGPYLERLFGRVRFAVLYMISALGGSVGYFVIVPANTQSERWFAGAVGASGAIFGLFAAHLIVNRRLGRDTSGIAGLIIINAVISFFPQFNIAWEAHLGGLISGGLAASVLAVPVMARRDRLQVASLVAVVVGMVALVLLKAAIVPDQVLL